MATPEAPTTEGGHGSDWFEERLRTRELFAALLHVRIPAEARTYYLGGITLFLFGVQVVTGTLLTLYYKPTPDTAFDSVKYITSVVEFGWLIRSVHHWAANLMIIFLVLHVVRIFVQGAYKYPRELTWIVGIGLLAVTIGFGFTGYLLPWDQRAFWASVVGTEIAGRRPARRAGAPRAPPRRRGRHRSHAQDDSSGCTSWCYRCCLEPSWSRTS